MVGSALVKKLETLSDFERLDFYEFLDYDKPQQVDKCKNTLRAYIDIINKGPSSNYNKLLIKAFGEEGINKQLRYIASYLSKSLDKYLAWSNLKAQPFGLEFSRLNYYNNVGLNKEFDKLAQSLIYQVEDMKDQSIDHYKHQMELYRALYINRSSQGRTGAMYLSEWRVATYNYFTTEMLRQQVLLHSYEIHNPDNEDLYREAIDHLLSHVKLTDSGKTYQLLKQLLVNDAKQEEVYKELSGIFKNQNHLFQIYEAKNILLILINFCIRQINEGVIDYQQHCLDWYRWGISKNILLDNNSVSKYTYKNMLSLTIKFNDFDEGYRMLDTYKPLLGEQEREAAYNFNLGRLLFHQKRYQEAMPILQMIDSPSLMDNLDVRRMLLRMYYEEEDFNILESHLVSFGSFLRRHKELGYHRIHYLNLVKYTTKLVRARSKHKRQIVKESILNCPSMVDKQWLLSMT